MLSKTRSFFDFIIDLCKSCWECQIHYQLLDQLSGRHPDLDRKGGAQILAQSNARLLQHFRRFVETNQIDYKRHLVVQDFESMGQLLVETSFASGKGRSPSCHVAVLYFSVSNPGSSSLIP